VQSVEPLDAQGAGQRYALELSGDNAWTDTAPAVAGRVAAAGIKLYALQPESRDLESVFGEISAR
jgi:ABC-2 type transport system ATP-binding protein